MAVIMFIARVVLSIILDAPMVGEELDDDTRERMRQREEQLRQEMTRLLQELEQRNVELMIPEQRSFAWGALLLTALQQWQFWAIAGVLLVLFGLCLYLRSRRYEVDNSGSEEESSSSDDEPMEVEEQQEEEEDEIEDPNDERDLGRIFAKRIQWPAQHLAYRSWMVQEMVGDLLRVSEELLSTRFFPVLQPAIRVGSAFEGWSPCEGDAVYRMLVPLEPPRGHAFHLELGAVREMPVKDSCIRVELECTCTGERLVEGMLCFLHHPEEELRRNQAPSLLHTLCTGSYLDVEKTAFWFQELVRSAWMLGSYSRSYNMRVLPSSNSCKLEVMNTFRRIFFVEIVFGVQEGHSDIFLCSQTTESICSPSTSWPESLIVAEAKFFSHVAREAPRDSFHLKCLQLCTRILVGTSFSSYTMKTIVMHLLTSIPLSHWRRRDFLLRLLDIMQYLRCCLEVKRLNHFFIGNENVPEEIILPPAFQTAAPLNLFQHLEQDPVAHTEALFEYCELQDHLVRLLFYGS